MGCSVFTLVFVGLFWEDIDVALQRRSVSCSIKYTGIGPKLSLSHIFSTLKAYWSEQSLCHQVYDSVP